LKNFDVPRDGPRHKVGRGLQIFAKDEIYIIHDRDARQHRKRPSAYEIDNWTCAYMALTNARCGCTQSRVDKRAALTRRSRAARAHTSRAKATFSEWVAAKAEERPLD